MVLVLCFVAMKAITFACLFAEIFKPKIISLSNQTSFKGNFSTVLFCNVSANPEASISWMKDDRSLTITQMPTVDCGRSLVAGYYQTKSNKYALVICHPSHKANSGRYRCTAKNRLGSESRDTYLNVLGMYLILEIRYSQRFPCPNGQKYGLVIS